MYFIIIIYYSTICNKTKWIFYKSTVLQYVYYYGNSDPSYGTGVFSGCSKLSVVYTLKTYSGKTNVFVGFPCTVEKIL